MFKKRSQAADKNVRRPGQALDDVNSVSAASGDGGGKPVTGEQPVADHVSKPDVDSGDDDDDDDTAVHRPAKRQRQQLEQHSISTTKSTPASAGAALTDPTLISIASSRSAQPDTATNSHRHTRFAPKHAPTDAAATGATPSLSLPSTNPAPSARFGPQRASGYARAISRIDFEPNVCKDYFECGSCGYGDSCKFLHDRLKYKAGWEVERDWEAEQKKKEAKRLDEEQRRARGETVMPEGGKGSAGEKAGLPFACYICREGFKQPVVTSCKHYFCERCALQRYAKTSRCAVCGKETQGAFGIARELLEQSAQPAVGNDDSDGDG